MGYVSIRSMQACTRFIFFGFAVLLLSASLTAAQQSTSQHPPPPNPGNPASDKDDGPLTTFEEEMRAKRAIKLAEKDHQDNVNRAREIGDIAKELQTALKDKTSIDRDSLKKIERLEKLTKKVRSEAGGAEEEVDIVDRPGDITAAVNKIAESAESLSKTVQNTPRQVVSASVIGNANVLLQLIKVLRGFETRP